MSTPHVQLRDEPATSSCWEVFLYACSSDSQKYIRTIGWILLITILLSIGFGIGLLLIWWMSDDTLDTGGLIVVSFFLGETVLMAIIGLIVGIGWCGYRIHKKCRKYYAKKKQELDKLKAESTPGSPV